MDELEQASATSTPTPTTKINTDSGQHANNHPRSQLWIEAKELGDKTVQVGIEGLLLRSVPPWSVSVNAGLRLSPAWSVGGRGADLRVLVSARRAPTPGFSGRGVRWQG